MSSGRGAVLDKLDAPHRCIWARNGSGYAMKLAVNLGLGAYIQALSESLALGSKQGLSARADARRAEGGARPRRGWLQGKLPGAARRRRPT